LSLVVCETGGEEIAFVEVSRGAFVVGVEFVVFLDKFDEALWFPPMIAAGSPTKHFPYSGTGFDGDL
jgi:hypothetical protein